MKIIFAQGNPGKEYAYTRHNIGFLVLDQIAAHFDVEFIKKSKFHAEIAEVMIKNEKVLLVKPTTFYNETGQAARLLLDFYKISPKEDLLVIHDELALPFGVIRTRIQGSDAGNNGIKSLNAHIGKQYARIRIGTHSEHRDRIRDANFVLASFSAQEKNALKDIFVATEKFVLAFITGSFTATKITATPLEQ